MKKAQATGKLVRELMVAAKMGGPDPEGNARLFTAIETGMFAEIKRPRDGGKGFDGVFEKSQDYWNPVEDYLKKKLKIAGRKSPAGSKK